MYKIWYQEARNKDDDDMMINIQTAKYISL